MCLSAHPWLGPAGPPTQARMRNTRDALSIAHLEGKGAWNVLSVPKDEERCSGGAREVYREGVPLLRVGEGERLLGPESAARLVDDQHEAPMRRPHLSRGALAQ